MSEKRSCKRRLSRLAIATDWFATFIGYLLLSFAAALAIAWLFGWAQIDFNIDFVW